MKATTAIGIGGAFACLLLATLVEGGSPVAFVNVPAFLISVGGTIMVTTASTTMKQMTALPKLAILAVKGSTLEPQAAVDRMVKLAEKARREGLLALEDDIADVEDAYERTGVQLVVDGADSHVVRAILQAETDGMIARHQSGIHVFQQAGGFAPTLGIIGTVMSLVHVLENLSSPATLGHSIAGAFLATLYGVGSANLVYLPIANKLKEMSEQEVEYREMLLEAILSVQAGDNPRMLAEKLQTFLPPVERVDPNAPVRPPAQAAETQQTAA